MRADWYDRRAKSAASLAAERHIGSRTSFPMLIRLATLLALLTSGLGAATETPDALRDRTLSLGAFLGRERLHLIAWSEKAEVVRIKIPHTHDDKRPETETYYGRPASRTLRALG